VRSGGGEWIRRDYWRGVCKASDELTFTCIRAAKIIAVPALGVGFLVREFFCLRFFQWLVPSWLADFRFQFGLEMVGPLMLGNFLEHPLQALQFLVETSAAIFLLDFRYCGLNLRAILYSKNIFQNQYRNYSLWTQFGCQRRTKQGIV